MTLLDKEWFMYVYQFESLFEDLMNKHFRRIDFDRS